MLREPELAAPKYENEVATEGMVHESEELAQSARGWIEEPKPPPPPPKKIEARPARQRFDFD